MIRPWKLRLGARVLLLSSAGVLLLHDSDPGIADVSWWVTPGGGIDPDEPAAAAACREVAEETGLELRVEQLIGPVARRRVVHGYSDRIRVQDEVFFRAEVAPFQATSAGWTTAERTRMRGFAWFPLDAVPADVWPAQLAQLAAVDPRHPLNLGVQEESTLPLTPKEWAEIGLPGLSGESHEYHDYAK